MHYLSHSHGIVILTSLSFSFLFLASRQIQTSYYRICIDHLGVVGMELILRFQICLNPWSIKVGTFCQKIGYNALPEVGRGCNFLQAPHLVDCSGVGNEGICRIAKLGAAGI